MLYFGSDLASGQVAIVRGPLYAENYRPQLSGHETFPLRYGWLKKAFDAVQAAADRENNNDVFLGSDSISRFGVGKNMVSAMRHWAIAGGIIEDAAARSSIRVTALGRRLFDAAQGFDPYMEHPDTSWLVHWHISGRPAKTTWYWVFNYYPALNFDRDVLTDGIRKVATERGWPRASVTTIRRDVACFLRSYVAQPKARAKTYEETLESPLAELGLVRTAGPRGGYRFVRGPKATLGAGAFCYALTDYWNARFADAQTLSFEALAHEPGSPGRVFLLDEDGLIQLLMRMESLTGGVYVWSETAGLKQLIRSRTFALDEALDLLASAYDPVAVSRAAA